MLKHIRDAIGLGFAWFLIGSFIGLIVFEGLVDPDGKIVDIWPAALGYPAFFGGAIFLVLTRVLGRHPKLHQVSSLEAVVLGALSAPLLVGTFVAGIVTGIFGDFKGDRVPWLGIAQITGLMIPSFALAAWTSVWMARQVEAKPGTRAEAS
jgi:hypothetical protein